jgi:DNA-binding NarL/FixJ family response regulator
MKIRVLVADDFPLVREGVAAALARDPGIEVVGKACGGEEALRLSHELHPDVLVLDLHMPDCGGVTVLERLREELPEVRTLVMTACASPESLLDAISAGARGYLTKMAAAEELRQAVITTFGDGSVIESRLTKYLVHEYSRSSRQEVSELRLVLSARESDILRLISEGFTDNEIGKQLFISPRTVQNHLTRIREKTGLRRRWELTRWAVEHAMTQARVT